MRLCHTALTFERLLFDGPYVPVFSADVLSYLMPSFDDPKGWGITLKSPPNLHGANGPEKVGVVACLCVSCVSCQGFLEGGGLAPLDATPA